MNFIIQKLVVLLCFLFLSNDLLFAQEKEKGKLDRAEKSVEKKKKKKNDKPSKVSDSENEDDEDDGFFCALVATGFKWAFWESPFENDAVYNGHFWEPRFSDFPYALPNEGLYSAKLGKSFSLKFAGHYVRHTSSITGFNFSGRLSPWAFMGFDINLTRFDEELQTRTDHLYFYDVMVNYYRVRLERWNLWYGLGYKGLRGDRTHSGFGFNIGADIYFWNPLSFYINYSPGVVEEATVSELITKLNFHVNRFKIFLGYQRYSTGSVVIDGLIFGTGIYF